MLKISKRMHDGMERMRQAAVGKADCVPAYAQIGSHAARLAGESTRKFYSDAETFLTCQLHADELYQIDSITTHYDCYNIEAEALGAPLIWNEGLAPEIDPANPLLKSVDDWRNLRPVRIGRAGRMPFVLEINQRLVDLGLPPKIRFCGLFSLAAKLLGFETLLTACLAEPEKVHALMRFLCDEVVAPWIVHQRQACGRDETATGSDAYASPPILSAPMVRQFCLRYIQTLEERLGAIRLAGLWGEQHVAHPRQLLDIKRQGCHHVFQALDPDVTALGPALFKRYADQHDMAIIMGLDAILIEQGPVSEIRARARRFIDEAGRDGRFVLFLNDVPPQTPPQHVHAAVSVAHEYRYR